jgi:hypothetical protein
MSIIKILVEGPTEVLFVNDVLRPHFFEKGIAVRPFLLQEGGGAPKYPRSQKQILNTIKADRRCCCTTLVDFYGLPKDWPGRKNADGRRAYLEKAATVEEALSVDICEQLGLSFDQSRFIPYVQMHEFEALLFSDISKLAERAKKREKISVEFEHILKSFSCPEEINDNYDTCPSRRIEQNIEDYVKTVDGIIVARAIGMEKMRQECPHFNEWITKLEGIGNQ